MKTKNNSLPEAHAMQHPNWLRPALMTLALATAVLGVTGCDSDKDKDKDKVDHSQHQK